MNDYRKIWMAPPVGVGRATDLPVGVGFNLVQTPFCWADRPGVDLFLAGCGQPGTGPLSLCPRHHTEMTGHPVLLSWGGSPA